MGKTTAAQQAEEDRRMVGGNGLADGRDDPQTQPDTTRRIAEENAASSQGQPSDDTE